MQQQKLPSYLERIYLKKIILSIILVLLPLNLTAAPSSGTKIVILSEQLSETEIPSVDDIKIKEAAAIDNKASDKDLFVLGYVYFYGKNVPQDFKKSLTYFQASADKGNMRAAVNAGRMYMSGLAAPASFEKGLKNLRAAETAKLPSAFYEMSLIYERGEGTFQDSKKSMEYLNMAAESGYVPASEKLSNMHHKGAGVPKDMKKAMSYLENILEKTDEKKQIETLHKIAGLYAEQNDVNKQMEYYARAAVCITKHHPARAAFISHFGSGEREFFI